MHEMMLNIRTILIQKKKLQTFDNYKNKLFSKIQSKYVRFWIK